MEEHIKEHSAAAKYNGLKVEVVVFSTGPAHILNNKLLFIATHFLLLHLVCKINDYLWLSLVTSSSGFISCERELRADSLPLMVSPA